MGRAAKPARSAASKSKAGGKSAGLLRYEHLHQPLASRSVFLTRMASSLALALCLIAASLSVGMIGYHQLGPMPWIDAFENASMILSGMGPLAQMAHDPGKLFAGLYALYSGLLLVATASLILGPVLHRFLHRLHIAEEDED
ncbi:MAG: hypothetical protein JWM33_576 [Caulobacteraceae bacterium]|nr:hypothetical protein [Caulobacteraceae bacterium]